MNRAAAHLGADLAGDDADFRPFERLARKVLDHIPGARHARTRDVVEIAYDADDESFVVLVTPEAVELRLPTVDWVTPYTPVPSSTLWKRVAMEKLDAEAQLPALIVAARQAYAKSLRACRYCKHKFPPHRMISRKTCHGCAEKHEGVVF